MYAAKEVGRNRYQFYTDSMNRRAAERLNLEHELRFALERGEFHLVYQPQFDLASGAIVGLEALARWVHPQLGLVPPARFIAVAEESGLIVRMGEWVLRNACAQNRQLQDAGLLRVPVAVNVSAIQFRQATFARMVGEVLDDTGLSPLHVELEVTESVVMEAPEATVEKLRELASRGLRLSIDDFGTGYSSLNYLRHLRLHQLKVDRSFVNDLPRDRDSAAITRAIVSMGRSLGLTVIAEGVERTDQAAFLKDIDCAYAQGFLYCPPLPAAELAQRVIAPGRLRAAGSA
jgi:EAL domain-containing protein (putative c-di-GMP-specific phosphodiesterase class I)